MSSSLLQVSKLIHVDKNSTKWERFPKHSRSEELFVVVHNIIYAKLLNPFSAVSDTSIKTLA